MRGAHFSKDAALLPRGYWISVKMYYSYHPRIFPFTFFPSSLKSEEEEDDNDDDEEEEERQIRRRRSEIALKIHEG